MPGKCAYSRCTEPDKVCYVCVLVLPLQTLVSNNRCSSRPPFPEKLCTDGPHHAFELNFCEPMFANDNVLYFR